MSDLKELIAQRGRIKTRITLFEKYMKPLYETKLTKNQFNELTLRLSKLQDLSYSFDELQSKIESLDLADDQMSEREEVENRFYSLIAQTQDILQTFEAKVNDVSSSASQSSHCSHHDHQHLKLPTLKIPPFGGEPGKWLEFRDTYSSLIHHNDSIDNVSKFHYLKSYLEGTAKAVIASVTVSSTNYSIAWALLCDRFNNKRMLINEHIKCLFALEPLAKESDKGLRSMIDAISKNLSALNSLDEPTASWDTIIIYMASERLDPDTARAWEEHRSTLSTTSLDKFFDFLRHRATVLETVRASKTTKHEKRNNLTKSKSFMVASPESSQSTSQGASNSSDCIACHQKHKLYECTKFKTLPIEDRITKVFEWKLCNNCLRGGHRSAQCRLGGCRICYKKHNTVLHRQSSLQTNTQPQQESHEETTSLLTTTSVSNRDTPTASASASSSSALPRQEAEVSSGVVSMSNVSSDQVLLSTVLVEVTNDNKNYTLKALLDSGSQSSFITDAAVVKLGLSKTKITKRCVSGLSNAVINITDHCDLVIHSSYSSFSAPVTCYVIPIITDRLPQLEIRVQELGIPNHIQLADPTFYRPADIDMLLGADVFWEIIGTSQIRLGPNKKAFLRETQLGWIVAGPMGGKHFGKSNHLVCNFSREVQQQLSRFWELEEVPAVDKPSSAEHDYCENFFTKTTYRDANGRFCVELPLRDSPCALGESYHIAEKRLIQVERKLSRSPILRNDYNKFMEEYERLGHMSEVSKPSTGCYLPHHAVIRESSETTKLRVVFDASAQTSSGVSLNDIQYVGPVVQDDLFSILLRFRQHRYVVSADVEKMYRQIELNKKQRPLQMILWREREGLPIKIFELNTVTYGTASAPYLSTRCLLQLAKENPDETIAELIEHDFYVDDFLSGSSSESELSVIINKVTKTLHSAGLPLRKFRTNAPSIVLNNPSSLIPKELDSTSLSSALGLKWDPAADVLNFSINVECPYQATKRTILSNSAKLFDPLGLLSPCTIIPKIILQKLWISNLNWDDTVPSEVKTSWLDFVANLKCLSSLHIPRFVLCVEPEIVEMHAFCDASEVAYGTCIYLRSIDKSGQVKINLLCAKTKVAPLKPQTIPRLELCGAVLAARLSHKVMKALRLHIHQVYYWSDSSVVLGWLSSHARDLKTFVSNRVAEVQELTSSGSWRHVPGIQNPADLASRGLDPKHIEEASLWWHGPPFLLDPESSWPNKISLSKELPEIKSNSSSIPKTKIITCTTTTKTNLSEIVNFEKYSKFTTLQRSIAYVLRFIHNTRHVNSRHSGHLSSEELEASLNRIIKQHQVECFGTEINLIKNKKCLPSKSGLLSLRPFIDDTGILRVGGRIQRASENYSKIHPILLDSKHNFTKLLFAHEHKRLLHCGPQLLLTNLRQIYWPMTGRRLARSTVNDCVLCRIIKAKTINPIMGNLPLPRVTPNLPFQVSGVDFAGPFPIKDRVGRGCKIIKSYLCLFVCFSTRALHLEIASDMSSDVFILCLKRFISRRGKPSEIYCDNGRNFVGANNEFLKILETCNESVCSFAADEGIKFKFSPAYTPHFGGLWEAGVKSAKYHLVRMLGNTHLTYEELSTLFIQIEAILNSRPLCPLSSDPTDLCPLTPGHFLIGKPLTCLPTPLIDAKMVNRLSRYEEIEQMRQHFWQRWRREFLSELQQRSKWRIQQEGLLPGDLVILKEANVPPLKWKMGRIQSLYPGSDGVSRVADVFTSKGVVRRAISNLCPLPMGNPSEETSRDPKVVERGEDVPAKLA